MGRLEGKVAFVTGGSRGIGRACALALAKEGADLAVSYFRNRIAAGEVVAMIEKFGRRAKAYQADTSEPSQVESMVKEALKDYGKIDILLNNAGVLKRSPFLEIGEEEWDRIIGTDLKGYFLVGQAVAKHMVERRSGVVINISSANQQLAALNLTHYCVAKAGVAMLTKCMALELSPYNVRVNAIAPGLIETDLNRGELADREFRNRRLARIPLKIIGNPEDITGAVIFLASEDARLSTGQTLFLDAGANIWSG
jgi:NAD(P)-dependent dehydrogenase (short-subunit alcohol dehydrogenase family)